MVSQAQTFTVSRAAEVCQVSVKTVGRRLDQLEQGGAYKDKTGQWVIPLGALLVAGFTPGRPAGPDTVHGHQDGHAVDNHGQRIAELEAELSAATQRAVMAEAIAAERERTIAAQAQTLRMITAGPLTPAPGPTPAPDEAAAAPVDGADTAGPAPAGGVRRRFFTRTHTPRRRGLRLVRS
jgi:hypothetical protein